MENITLSNYVPTKFPCSFSELFPKLFEIFTGSLWQDLTPNHWDGGI